jgi:hypothetical protein
MCCAMLGALQANVRFSMVIEKIQPLEVELAEANAQLMESQARCVTDVAHLPAPHPRAHVGENRTPPHTLLALAVSGFAGLDCNMALPRLDTNTHELASLDKRVTELKNGFAKRTAEAETLRQVRAPSADVSALVQPAALAQALACWLWRGCALPRPRPSHLTPAGPATHRGHAGQSPGTAGAAQRRKDPVGPPGEGREALLPLAPTPTQTPRTLHARTDACTAYYSAYVFAPHMVLVASACFPTWVCMSVCGLVCLVLGAPTCRCRRCARPCSRCRPR